MVSERTRLVVWLSWLGALLGVGAGVMAGVYLGVFQFEEAKPLLGTIVGALVGAMVPSPLFTSAQSVIGGRRNTDLAEGKS